MYTEKDYSGGFTLDVNLNKPITMKCNRCGDTLELWISLEEVPDKDILYREYKLHIKDCGK